MKKVNSLLFAFLVFTTLSGFAQTQIREEKVGHVFSISVPDYLTRTIGINDAAIVQYKNEVKEVYCFVIEDSKADLELVDMKFENASEFYDNFIKGFLVGSKDRVVSAPKSFSADNMNFVQADVSYFDKDAKVKIYYNVTIAESKGYFYKILSYTADSNKSKLKDDLSKLGASLRE